MNYVVQAVITSKKMIQNDVVELIVKPSKIRPHSPASFVQLSLEIADASQRWPESRTFSIASYSKEYMRFLIKDQGEYTKRIVYETRVGKIITIKYPFGEMFNKKNITNKNIFIAGGLGITPFLSLIDYFEENKLDNYYLFYSAKTINQLIDVESLNKRVKNLHLYTTKEDSKYNSRRISIDDFSYLNLNELDHIYICGSKDFINYFKVEFNRLGIRNIHMDEWD